MAGLCLSTSRASVVVVVVVVVVRAHGVGSSEDAFIGTRVDGYRSARWAGGEGGHGGERLARNLKQKGSCSDLR